MIVFQNDAIVIALMMSMGHYATNVIASVLLASVDYLVNALLAEVKTITIMIILFATTVEMGSY